MAFVQHNSIVYLKTNTNYYIGRAEKLWALAFAPLNANGEYLNLSGELFEIFEHPSITADPAKKIPFLLQRQAGPGNLCIDDIFYLQTLEPGVRSGVRYLAPRSREGPLSYHDTSSEVVYRPKLDRLSNSMSPEWNIISRSSNGLSGTPVQFSPRCYSITDLYDPMDLTLNADHSRLSVIYPNAFLLNFDYEQVRWTFEDAGIVSRSEILMPSKNNRL